MKSIILDLSSEAKEVRPKLLLHPPIPPALGGVNPRTIQGKSWWDEVRRKVYASNNYCCMACGIHQLDTDRQWLEAHEAYEYDYSELTAKLVEIVPLCRKCHQFIHWRRIPLRATQGGLSGFSSFYNPLLEEVLRRGLQILRKHSLEEHAKAQYLVYEKLFKVDDLGFAIRRSKVLLFQEEVSQQESRLQAWSWKLVYKGVEYDQFSTCSPVRS